MTTSRPRGSSQSSPLRLCTRAPRMTMLPCGSIMASGKRAILSEWSGPPRRLRNRRVPGHLRRRAAWARLVGLAGSKRPHPGGGAAPMSTKKTPSGERRTATNPALEAFEKAVKALGKKDYQRAQELFGEILEAYPEETDLLERARSYRLVCERALTESRRGPFKPKTFDDMLQYGVF